MISPRVRAVIIGLTIGVVFGVTIALVANASYGATTYTIGFDHTAGAFGTPGSTLDLGFASIHESDRGRPCDVTVELTNDSKWPGTNLTLSSGSDSVNAADVETQKGTYTIDLGSLVLTETVTAALQFGSGGATSIEGVFSIACPDVPPINPENPDNPCGEACTPTTTTPPSNPPAPPVAAPVLATSRVTG